MQFLKYILVTVFSLSPLLAQDGADVYRVGKIHASAPIVHHTNFPTTQIFSLNNLIIDQRILHGLVLIV